MLKDNNLISHHDSFEKENFRLTVGILELMENEGLYCYPITLDIFTKIFYVNVNIEALDYKQFISIFINNDIRILKHMLDYIKGGYVKYVKCIHRVWLCA